MISVQRPVTTELFREFFEDRFVFLFSDEPHGDFWESLREINQMILFAQQDEVTTARQFTDDELEHMAARLRIMHTLGTKTQLTLARQEFSEILQKIGLKGELPSVGVRIA